MAHQAARGGNDYSRCRYFAVLPMVAARHTEWLRLRAGRPFTREETRAPFRLGVAAGMALGPAAAANLHRNKHCVLAVWCDGIANLFVAVFASDDSEFGNDLRTCNTRLVSDVGTLPRGHWSNQFFAGLSVDPRAHVN